MFARKYLESNILYSNRLYDLGEAKISDGCMPWAAALLLYINITSNPRYVFSYQFSRNSIHDYLITYEKLKKLVWAGFITHFPLVEH